MGDKAEKMPARVTAAETARDICDALADEGYQPGGGGGRADALFAVVPVVHAETGTKLIVTVARVA